MRQISRYIIATILLLTTLCRTAYSEHLSPCDVTNPQQQCFSCWVSDDDHILSNSTKKHINEQITSLNTMLGVQIAVAIVPGIEGDDEYDFAYQLFNHWQIGEKGKNNGLLFLYVVNIRAMKFETGYALEGLLPDAYLDGLLNETIFPLMRQGAVDQAFTTAIDKIYARLTTDEAREELLLNTAAPQITAGNTFATYFTIALLMLILMSLVVYHTTKNLRGENNVRYEKMTDVVKVTGILSFVFPLPMIFLWHYTRRHRQAQRLLPKTCDHCGGTMRCLSEEEEDRYLNFGQQAEERVKSVDYDVWHCNVCSHNDILPYAVKNTKYTKCPQCGARTYILQSDYILLPATTLSTGKGERTYQCANCGLKKVVPYIIPLIIVATTAGRGNHGGFGGGISSGGFGGGMSGGGGAGGRF